MSHYQPEREEQMREAGIGPFSNVSNKKEAKEIEGEEDMSPYESRQIENLLINKEHYKGGIEPTEYIKANSLDFFEGNVVKYITRWRKKDGINDLRKAKDYIEMLIKQEIE
tara:strand:- start:350 stop:682 length:333 start_codon:yes stop_codon:yes gene_type:complete